MRHLTTTVSLLFTLGAVPEAAAASPAAADTLAGRVTDQDGRPVASAYVVLSELHRQALTTTEGTFSLAPIPPGRYTVIIRRLGYRPVARAVTVEGLPH